MADDESNCRGDLRMILGGRIPLEPSSVFSASSLLIMEFALCHVFTGGHSFKADAISNAEKLKQQKYTDLYQQLGFAFAPLVASSFGVCGPDLLRFLWAVADHAARYAYGLPLDVYLSLSQPSSDHDPIVDENRKLSLKILRACLYNEYRLRTLTAIYEAATFRVFGRSFALNMCCFYREQLAASRATWQPMFHSLPADGLTSPMAEGTLQSPGMSVSTPLSTVCHLSSTPDSLPVFRFRDLPSHLGCV